MAAHGGTEWSSVVKPLINNRYGVLNKTELINLIKAITRCENEFFDEENSNLQFYTAFAALAAEKLSQCKTICQTQIPQMQDACAILIRFILGSLSKVSVQEIKWLLPALKSLLDSKESTNPFAFGNTGTTGNNSGNATNTNTSNISGLQQFDYNAVIAVLKSCKYPESNKSIVTGSSSSSSGSGSGSSDKDSPKSEVKRSRSDLSSIIIQQLASSLEVGKFNWTPLSEEISDCTDIFRTANVLYLQSLNGADNILDICISLPTLARYRLKYQETIGAVASPHHGGGSSGSNNKTLYLPLTQVEATQIKNTLNQMAIDVSILSTALSLPVVVQPLSSSRIVKLSKCAISALYCGVLTSIASSVLNMSNSSTASGQKSQQATTAGGGGSGSGTTGSNASKTDADESEEKARYIVDKALEIYTVIGQILKNSARAHVYQNHLCYGAWLLVSGIQGALGASGSSNSSSSTGVSGAAATSSKGDDGSKSGKTSGTPVTHQRVMTDAPPTPTARVNLFKVQQGFGVLNAAIANHCIKLLTELIDDLKIESVCSDNYQTESVTSGQKHLNTAQQLPEPADFDILVNYTSLQRVVRVLSTATLHQLFTFLATVSYRKACALRRASAKDRTECEAISYSDSTTYFNDTLSCSDNSEEDDSESYLGHWFKETLSPEANDDANNSQSMEQRNADGAQKSNLVAAVDEPHEYLELAAHIFCFLDQFFANKEDFYLQRYIKAGLSDQQMLLMANILKDLDRDAARAENEAGAATSNNNCPKWQAAMIRFSGAVGRYLHNLVSASLLNESLQSNLLQHLGVSPWSTESNAWPLQVYSSTLSVLVQILLLKPTQEKEAACLSVWHRLINTLVEGVCATSTTSTASDVDYEDLNVEHAQLLLFLFHSLNLMQKKSILLLTAGGVIRCAEICRGISAERPVRNSQIMLLSRLLLFLEYLMKHLYHAPIELLDQVRWNLFSVNTMNQGQKVTDLINNKTKLTSFCRRDIEDIFRKSTSEYLSNIRPTFYTLAVEANSSSGPTNEFKLDGLAWNFILCTPDKLKYPLLVNALIDILDVTDIVQNSKVITIHTLCAMQYCFSICWKLLLGLPPSTVHVESLMEDKVPNLHSLLWSIRCPMAGSHYLIVNSLIKQGMYTQCAEKLYNNVTERVADVRFNLKHTLLGVESFNEFNKNRGNVRLSRVILLDALISHMRAVIMATEKDEVKSTQRKTVGAVSATAATGTGTGAGGGSSTGSGSGAGNVSPISPTSIEEKQQEVYSSTESIEQRSKSVNETPEVPREARSQHVQHLLLKLTDTLEIMLALVRRKMSNQLTDESLSAVEMILELALPIASAKNAITAELNEVLHKLLTNHDKEIVQNEWPKCLPITDSEDTIGRVEDFTLEVISAHVSELTRNASSENNTNASNYTVHNSLKNSLKSVICLINLLLPNCRNRGDDISESVGDNDEDMKKGLDLIEVRLKCMLSVIVLDVRFDYVHEIGDRCLKTLLSNIQPAVATTTAPTSTPTPTLTSTTENNDNISANVSNETLLLLLYEYVAMYCYKLVLEISSEMQLQHQTTPPRLIVNESLIVAAVKTLNLLLDKPTGLKAMYNFFKVSGDGNLVELMLSFAGTSLSMTYVKRLLQLIERMFQLADNVDSDFPLNELIHCFDSLASVEATRLKTWLSHVIYGPNLSLPVEQVGFDAVDKALQTASTTQPFSSSTPSSNAQTPTNMATVSAMPSISDQMAQSQSQSQGGVVDNLEEVAMEIGYPEEEMVVAVYTVSGGAPGTENSTQAATTQQQPQNAGSFVTNHSEESLHIPATGDTSTPNRSERNGALLLSVVKHIVGDTSKAPTSTTSSNIAMSLFVSLLQLGLSLIAPPQESTDFADILQIMITLADTAQHRGHATLFEATISWLELMKMQIIERSSNGKQALPNWLPPANALDNISAVLKYLCELLQSLGYKGSRSLSPPWDDDMQSELEELMDDIVLDEQDDSFVDDSDEDSLNNKLCTFSQTQKEFMNQHWYHCHSCNMVNTVGVCSVCARVCHKGHDVSYAKYGNFFCDCGAKEDGSCQALSRRVNTGHSSTANAMQSVGVSGESGTSRQMSEYVGSLSNKRRAQTPPTQFSVGAGGNTIQSSSGTFNTNARVDINSERVNILSKLLEKRRDVLLNTDQWSTIASCILDLFDILMPAIRENCAQYSIVGCHSRAKAALARLHTPQQTFHMTDQLFLPTLGSQEGAFENVRMNYSGDQGQTIKQLMSSGLVRRIALCCLSSPQGKRQLLAVSHEKGKVTILQLSALLKQADAAKRKLTLTQLSSAPIPCTVLSLSSNPTNEDCLAVCGLKECHILTFSSSGATNEHIVITTQLENGNFIKKAVWLPGSQCVLALVTADYVKIYDLSEDVYSPKYYFLVAVGKIRDCTFVYQEVDGVGVYFMLIIASSGYIYYQILDEHSLAKHGDFYVTNTLDLNHPNIKDLNGQVGGGGISIYYSQTLQLLFFSYTVGHSFMAALSDVNEGIKGIQQLQASPGSKNSSKGPPQPLCQWTEIPGHPGIICSMMQTSNNLIIFMLEPDRIHVQEIKPQPSKPRITDMVAIRHTAAGVGEKTTLILLCEDGSLRIFTAQPENTSFWLSPQVNPAGNQMYSGSFSPKSSAVVAGGKKFKRKSHTQQKTVGPNGAPIFPIDFFEHCTILSEVEFGGSALLQIYNKAKLKTRLHSAGMYIVAVSPHGFTLEVYNNDANMVIVGLRVLLGTQDPLRAPQNVTVLGRTIPTNVRRARWFDIPLTREEMLQSDKCVKLVFGKSQDPENVIMLDSIEVYGKSKDQVGWPDDLADEAIGTHTNNISGVSGAVNTSGVVSGQPCGAYGEGFYSMTHLDKMVTHLLEVLDCSLNLLSCNSPSTFNASTIKNKATKTITSLLLLPTPNQVQVQSRYVLATLFGNRTAYHAYKDKEMLAYVNGELQAWKSKKQQRESLYDIDPEAFYRLVLLVRSIATARPQCLTRICVENKFQILQDLKEFAELLYQITPKVDEPISIVRRGLCQPETIVHCLVEILNAFALSDSEQVERVTRYFIDLLKNESITISHSAKEAIILLLSPRLKRRKVVAIVTPPTCSTPTPSNAAAKSISSSNLASGIAAIDAAEATAEEVLEAAAVVANVAGAAGGEAPAIAAGIRSNSAEFIDPMIPEAQLLEAFMGGGFPQLLGLQQDADDEAIMDIAIALSLQQHGDGLQSLQQGLANLQGIRNAAPLQQLPPLDPIDRIGMALNAAAGGGSSDDEGSNVATDGSTLRTSPAEAAGSGGSESGGSGVESIGGTSGRSSTYGDPANSSPPRSAVAQHAAVELPSSSKANASGTTSGAGNGHQIAGGASGSSADDATSGTSASTGGAAGGSSINTNPGTIDNEDNENEAENMLKLHELRIAVLENIIENLGTLDNCTGVQAIPLIQVIFLLTTDLNGNCERDQKILNDLLTALVKYVEMDSVANASKLNIRSSKNEVRLVILCLFGVLMGKTKSKQVAGTTSPPHQFKDNASFVASTTASILSNNGAFTFALIVMKTLLVHWKRVSIEQGNGSGNSSSSVSASAGVILNANASAQAQQSINGNQANGSTNTLLKPMHHGPRPDISILIPHNYLKNYPDIFEAYDALLTEVSVRLPYQILRLSSTHPGTYDWYHNYCESMTFTLCEYMMLNLNTLLRRQVRKLLLYICGNKEKFRMFRDGHSLDVHFNQVKDICRLQNTKNTVLSNQCIPMLNYDSLVELTEHFRTCQEISQIRTGNWQKFCLIHEDVIPVLIEIACYQLDDGVSPIILQLLQAALCNNAQANKQQQQQQQSTALAKSRAERDKSEDIEITFDSKFDPSHCTTFVHQIFRFVSDSLLNKFVRIFLLETNITSIRWQAHSLVYAMYEHSNDRQKEKLINILWTMWPLVPAFGRRTAQFVDILGYLTLSTQSIVDKLPEYTEKAVEILRQQNVLLAKHPNAPIYSTLEQILQVSGYYLESEPCLVCNNPEVSMANIKLPSIKSDSKFTTTTMIVKLVQSHTISKLIVRIADLKRTKMVRSINIYYNNRTVQAVVELKNRPAMWHKARTVTLQSGQTEVKIDFPLPITACNLMIEYADFYETVTGSSENLQCPRCSAAVPAYPGVCANCGENVFQCHKCRAINYDEKDPFLCHSCGFCKYAKFDFSIYGRVCCAVDPIESAEDRAKTVHIIHSSLERADRIYRQLQTNKQMLELLIQKVSENRCTSSDRLVDDHMSSVHSTSQVNKIIQLLAQKYCVESRTSFEELSKIVQRVKACRSELVAYDRCQLQDQSNNMLQQYPDLRENFSINRCYGCALASTEQSLTLLRAMASNYECRIGLYSQGLLEELTLHNLRRGTPQIQDEVRNLLVLLTKNNKDACMNLLELIAKRVRAAVTGTVPLPNLDAAVHHEMILLEVLISQDDFCWEQKLKVVFELFKLTCCSPRGPSSAIIQPCLRIMQALICPTIPTSKLNMDLSPSELSTIILIEGLTVNFSKWLKGDALHEYPSWKQRMPPNTGSKARKAITAGNTLQGERIVAAVIQSTIEPNRGEQRELSASEATTRKKQKVHDTFLIEKYGRRWRNRMLSKDHRTLPLVLNASWVQPILFNTSSRFGRQLICSLISSLSRTYERKCEVLNLLTGFLKHVGEAGEASSEFLSLYRSLSSETPWRQYLALKGVLMEISQLLTAEIVKVHRLEETTLSSDLSQGYALRQFVELLAIFLEKPNIRQAYKTRLLGPVLEGYLSLRKLVVQRTRLIDDAQEKLLEMLEEMTTGTEEETRAFMEILIDTVEKTRMNDIKTPVFIFERLYSIIHPEESDESEFFMTLEKDPQQEDFLQGRMLGNPYPSTEPHLGPLMRDVKNKICRDCELIALLEDDNGMELLVNNKIISLDLPVKDVYKKVWLAEGGERDAMRIVYRMRGLLGDATEEFVETLNNKSQEEVDNEQLYRMANVLADCNGLKVMLDRIGSLQNITRTRELIQVLLKLFLICVKVRRCQDVLCQPELGAINTLLKVLQMCLQSENDSLQSAVTEQLLEIMETILSKAASDTLDSFLQFSLTFGGPEYVSALISCTDCPNVRYNPSVLRHLIRVLAALVYGNEVKMALLCEHFKETLDFNHFDTEHTPEEEFKLELFCVLTNQIEHNCIGGTLKDYIVSLGIVERAITYITNHAPCVKPTLLRTDSDELKEFISRPSLKYILRFLTGLATKHEATQVAISKDIIPIIHRLEQVSSDEHVGSLAENLLEALCTDEATAARVQEVRDFTRAEKKRLAMATREKQLDALGMRTNEKGQVTAKGSILQKIEKLRDETGLTCFICREGYACQPAKVLGIYTFTKRCNVEEFELKSRKTVGYTTVTHFNVVHVDCHTSAIRLARGRDEWERASLQNANTRCNGLLPLWGPEVSEAAFSACMTRHSSYMQESTQRCDISFPSSIHDLKLLLMRFAWERSFHDDAGGGGPQSNMHFVPYLLFYAVYLSLSSRSAARDSKALMSHVTSAPSEKWLMCGYEVEGPLYMITLSLALHSQETWNKHKIAHLKRLIAVAHARHISPSVQCKALLSASDRQAKEYSVYRPFLMMWAVVDMIYNSLFKSVSTPKEDGWSISLFDFIRKNDEVMIKSTDSILETFTEEFLPCTSFGEFCDVACLLHLVENPDNFISDILASLPTTSTA